MLLRYYMGSESCTGNLPGSSWLKLYDEGYWPGDTPCVYYKSNGATHYYRKILCDGTAAGLGFHQNFYSDATCSTPFEDTGGFKGTSTVTGPAVCTGTAADGAGAAAYGAQTTCTASPRHYALIGSHAGGSGCTVLKNNIYMDSNPRGVCTRYNAASIKSFLVKSTGFIAGYATADCSGAIHSAFGTGITDGTCTGINWKVENFKLGDSDLNAASAMSYGWQVREWVNPPVASAGTPTSASCASMDAGDSWIKAYNDNWYAESYFTSCLYYGFMNNVHYYMKYTCSGTAGVNFKIYGTNTCTGAVAMAGAYGAATCAGLYALPSS